MNTEHRASKARRIVGDILLVLVLYLAASVVTVMPARIGAVVKKADYRQVYSYQLFICAVLLVFALDVRFNLFTRWKPVLLKAAGWIMRSDHLPWRSLREEILRRPVGLRGIRK